ncbi:bifunctional hydroxymethylpyrimidine kinase/phosphomethylpyrimidine kinase [Paenibacillus sp. NEAU-GSW1]|uniref:bifunctional hydroxymethylpyrimidine kinase/phosphomethylpyrimidine kinase n=1 Tax=Paenibacillus sp. NEAU-GSW1 TaxID=2682486 RepID=UPI0012E15D8D|nr:bifunctional hydroxymethylpyrimidine kinase/phosphomethylpyrimidine kinase [Paenibacillus sp. NEAU-GSW1]MUT65740.1 bifunctional hydroxymethylpyrimidine kinase/phosphomethylpyrimidine kinase [Paenibacillus sp. NEAU-GSW1]
MNHSTGFTGRALTIAGSDSGGGAGIQADLKTFQELGAYGMSALTAATAQNTLGVQGVYPLAKEAVAAQIHSVGSDIGVDALKTGMLFSADIIETVAEAIAFFGWTKVVVDPVMIAKGGASLLQDEAVRAMTEKLLPLTAVVTPNIPEAERLTGVSIRSRADKIEAAKRLAGFGARNVIIKGGHEDGGEAVDLLFDGSSVTEMSGKRIETARTHGTGCTYSAALTAGLAQGMGMEEAARRAKAFIQAAIEDGIVIGSGHGPTNHWAYRRKFTSVF